MRDIGKNIKAARIRKKLTQDELAEKLYVTRQTVSNYETGHSRPDVESLISISEILGVELEELLYGERREEGRRKKLKAFIIATAVTAIIWITALIFLPSLSKLASTRYIMTPFFLVRGVLFPALYFMLGFIIALGCEIFLGAKPPKFLSNIYVRIIYIAFLVICAALLLPAALSMLVNVITWLVSNTYPSWSSNSIPIIGNLSARFLLWIYSNAYIALPFGAGLWLVSANKTKNEPQ